MVASDTSRYRCEKFAGARNVGGRNNGRWEERKKDSSDQREQTCRSREHQVRLRSNARSHLPGIKRVELS